MLIYLARNTVNGKCYVGQTIRTLERRKVEHKATAVYSSTPLYNAIRKHGWDAFEWETLEVCEDADDVNMAERFWIACYGSLSPQGYNLTTGGQRYHLTPEVRAKVSAARKRPENIALIKAIGAANRGRARPDTVAKFSKAVSVYDQSGAWLSTHPSSRAASRATDIHFGTISDCLKGRIKSARNKNGVVHQFRFGERRDDVQPVTYKSRG